MARNLLAGGNRVVELNTKDASKLGIADGQMVKVSSRRGEVTSKAQVSDGVKPGVVFMPWHFVDAAANKLTIAAVIGPHGQDPRAQSLHAEGGGSLGKGG